MPAAGDIVTIARREPHRAFAPAILAIALGAVIAVTWAVTASRNIRELVREAPAHFAPALQAVAEAKADVGTDTVPLRQVVDAVSADLQVRRDAQAALGEAFTSEPREQP
jgi:hypothetical protein